MLQTMRSMTRTAVFAAATFLWVAPATAEPILALTVQNQLISFDSATPATTTAGVSIPGLLPGDVLVGIDQRPSLGPNNGVLYGVAVNLATGAGRIYTIDPTTGVATPGAILSADPSDLTAPFPFTIVTGTDFGVDFNPVADRLRVTSNTGQNLRINVDNGFTQLDVPLAYDAGDPNFGLAPVDVAVAYANNFGGALTTTLRGVDIARSPDLLVLHANPNGGVLQTSLMLPFDSSSLASYDISGLTGTPYFAVNPAGSGSSLFYAAGPGGVALIGQIGGGVAVRGIAAPVGAPVGAPVPEPATMTLMALGAAGWLGRRALRRKGKTLA